MRSAMPGYIAKKLCPELVIVPCNFEKARPPPSGHTASGSVFVGSESFGTRGSHGCVCPGVRFVCLAFCGVLLLRCAFLFLFAVDGLNWLAASSPLPSGPQYQAVGAEIRKVFAEYDPHFRCAAGVEFSLLSPT